MRCLQEHYYKVVHHGLPIYSVGPQSSSGHRLIWWGVMRYRFAMNPMLHRTVLRKSITFAYVHLRRNKYKLVLEEA